MVQGNIEGLGVKDLGFEGLGFRAASRSEDLKSTKNPPGALNTNMPE